MSYPGGKGNCFREIINLMPPHSTYIETHLGGGSVFLNKRLASTNILNDIDPAVTNRFLCSAAKSVVANCRFSSIDAVELLDSLTPSKSMLAYCDPPYPLESRRSGRLYRYEYTAGDHVKLVDAVLKLNCMVIVSGYPNTIYSDALSNWNCHTFTTPTRSGTIATEKAWFNFPVPEHLHDYNYIGSDFRKREIFKRQKMRLIKRLEKMEPQKRHSLILAITDRFLFDSKFIMDNYF